MTSAVHLDRWLHFKLNPVTEIRESSSLDSCVSCHGYVQRAVSMGLQETHSDTRESVLQPNTREGEELSIELQIQSEV